MPNETTRLSPAEEERFQTWARDSGITDVDHPDSHYDYRGVFLKVGGVPIPQTQGRHLTDQFKQHGHPTFSQESQYSAGPADGGMWIGPRQNVFFAQPKMMPAHQTPLEQVLLQRLLAGQEPQ